MPALAFLAVVGLALVALLLVADATLKPVIVTSQRSGPPKLWHPGAIQTLTTAPAPDMTSQAVLAAQPKSAPEAPAKIESAAREARAEAPPKKARVEGSAKKAKKALAEAPPQNKSVTEPVYHQQNQFDRFSIKGY
jgi:hypothetical protein